MQKLPEVLTVRFRVGGERMAASHGQRTLKRLLQEQRLPPWLRDAVPLVYAAGRLVAVADWWCDSALQHAAGGRPLRGAARARLIWHREPPRDRPAPREDTQRD